MENVIIIGGGPAGLAAAIYTARAGLTPLVFAGSPPGGQLMITSEVENYPGFESILGPELIEKMRRQAKKFGAKIVDENVVKVDFSQKPFKIYLADSSIKFLSRSELASPDLIGGPVASRSSSESEGSLRRSLAQTSTSQKNFISSSAVLIATGAKALWLGLESEKRLRGKGVSACATCDGFFFKDKVVGVVGGGDTAMEEALTLTKFAKKIYLIHRRDSFRASKIMKERVFANPKIEIIWNAQVEEVLGKEKVEGIILERVKPVIAIRRMAEKQSHEIATSRRYLGTRNDNKQILNLDGLFIAIGHKPDTEIFNGQVEMDKNGYILTTNRVALENLNIENSLKIVNLKLKIPKFDYQYQYQTSVSGVFTAGDCVDFKYRQAGVAVGMGIAAALEVERYLEA